MDLSEQYPKSQTEILKHIQSKDDTTKENEVVSEKSLTTSFTSLHGVCNHEMVPHTVRNIYSDLSRLAELTIPAASTA